jgi:dTMP kinase
MPTRTHAPRKRPGRRRKAFFVSFEGVDGSGKSTQIHLLEKRLKRLGFQVFTLREPGGTRLGERIRHLLQYDRKSGAGMTPEAETLLFCASRAQLVAETIRPALAAGQVVLADRFLDSTTVYQGCGRRLGIDAIGKLHEFSVNGCRPALTVILVMKPEASLQRSRRRSRRYDRMERQKKIFYRLIDRGYRAIARMEPARIKLVRADRPPEVVAAEIWRLVARKLGVKLT